MHCPFKITYFLFMQYVYVHPQGYKLHSYEEPKQNNSIHECGLINEMHHERNQTTKAMVVPYKSLISL